MTDRYVVRKMDRNRDYLKLMVKRGFMSPQEASGTRWEVWDTVEDKRVPFGIHKTLISAERHADRRNR